jgi:hypothetical protein
MSIIARLFGSTAFLPWLRARPRPADDRELYPILRAYYLNNDLYAALEELRIQQPVRTRPLRNPAHAVVEFYAATLWGDAEVTCDDPFVLDAAKRVLEWSNWGALRQRIARLLALYGDLWVKVATRQDGDAVRRVFLQVIEPTQVANFAEDERGFLTEVVLEAPADDPDYLIVEHWEKPAGIVTWHLVRRDRRSEQGPIVRRATVMDLGFDFIPIVHLRFRDIGEPRGIGAFTHALDMIDEANRMATRLVELMYRYNRPDLVLRQTDTRDPLGRPLPPPEIARRQSSDVFEFGSERVTALPPGWDLQHVIPQVDWGSYLSALDAQLTAIERYALPELMYYRLSEMGTASGRALRIALAPAIARLSEARHALDTGIARAVDMAVTIGAVHGLWSVPEWELGRARVRFTDRALLVDDEFAPLEREQLAVAIARAKRDLGLPLSEVLRDLGYDEARIQELVQESLLEQEQQRERMANLLAAGWTPGE